MVYKKDNGFPINYKFKKKCCTVYYDKILKTGIFCKRVQENEKDALVCRTRVRITKILTTSNYLTPWGFQMDITLLLILVYFDICIK